MAEIRTVLVANRGEIACRVIRTAHRLGISTVAVYSEPDAGAPHVRLADRAIALGGSEAQASYLVIDKILEAARRTGADAIHPGYGFLSENAEFARRCADSGVVFIGPTPDAIDAMGDKARAKALMLEAGVPCVPGYQGEDQSDEALANAAESIGYPLLLKAAAGGGGRGMRRVDDASELATAIQTARSEALNSFGSGHLLIEKLVESARHIEIQVFGDTHGDVLYLGERDCSAQRRYQKVIEEAPGPSVSPELRRAMGEAAVRAAKAVKYVGAGTVEFLCGADDSFYFLEMNTRLQVEHPVTELIVGLDLVEWQLRVASGERLPLSQAELRLDGHAIEVRLYAEEPAAEFAPRTGSLLRVDFPSGEGIRVDAGVETGSEISPYYDSMVAKVIAYAPTRAMARRRLRRALLATSLLGVDTNRAFLVDLLEHPRFASGEVTTSFIESEFEYARRAPSPRGIAAVAALWTSRSAAATSSPRPPSMRGFRVSHPAPAPVELRIGGQTFECAVMAGAAGFEVTLPEAEPVVASIAGSTDDPHGAVRVTIDGLTETLHYAAGPGGALWYQIGLESGVAHAAGSSARQDDESESDPTRITAPNAGTVTGIECSVGAVIEAGDTAVVIEAMKMATPLATSIRARVKEVAVGVGDSVQPGQLLIELEPAEEGA